MDTHLASQILGGMKQDKAAEVLGRMSSSRARLLTEKFLGKRYLASSQPKVNEGGEPREKAAPKE